MNALLQELSTDEIQECVAQLERALDNHAAWLGQINEALICHLPPRPEDLSENAHHHCQFGQWYHNLQHPVLSQSEEFALIGEIHHQMHAKAREILIKSGRGEDIERAEYVDLHDQVSVLRKLIYSLGVGFTRDLGLISKLADKIFEHASEGVMISDPAANIINVNNAFTHVTGYSREEVVGNRPACSIPAARMPNFTVPCGNPSLKPAIGRERSGTAARMARFTSSGYPSRPSWTTSATPPIMSPSFPTSPPSRPTRNAFITWPTTMR